MINHLAVIIPARDEESLIGNCLRSVQRASRALAVPVSITVVADGCVDRTAAEARSFDGVHVVEIESSNVGTARGAGASWALDHVSRRSTWLANTDADSEVPANWLTAQLDIAAAGFDVMVGTVRPTSADLSADQLAAWRDTHTAGSPNGHVHGANLGIRASAYLEVGGYHPLHEHEDVELVERLAGFNVVASDVCEVVTSGREFGRTPGGYARYLREELLAARRLEVAGGVPRRH